MSDLISKAASGLGEGPLSEELLVRHIHPLFSRVLQRDGIYLANHSLGRPLDQTAADVKEAIDLWYQDMDGALGPWLAEINAFRERTSKIIGVSRADCIAPKTAAGQGLRAVLNALDGTPKVLATRGEFDSIDFILKTYQLRGRAKVDFLDPTERHEGVPLFDAGEIAEQIRARKGNLDLVVVSHVYYATGQLLEGLARVIDAAHEVGAKILLDCYHSEGVLPIGMEALGVDFAIGGSYKYLRGGPGACWLAIHPKHLSDSDSPTLRTLDTGWFAKKDTFAFQRPEAPLLSPGGDAWLESTPAPLTAYQARAGQQLILAIGVERLRQYNMMQQSHLERELRDRGVPARTLPARGAYLLIPHSDASGFCETLAAQGVVADSRSGHVRFCPDVLNTRDELTRAAAIISGAM